jgi:hypothetical protein
VSPLFGFAQFDFAGPLPLADGRYVARAPGAGDRVLVLATVGAAAQPGRRRKRPRAVEAGAEPAALPLARATAVRAFAPFDADEEALRWLEEACEAEETADELVAEGIELLNAAIHARAIAAADPHLGTLTPERAVATRLGYGSGEQVAEGEWTEAREVDVWATGASRRRRREEDLRPQERVAALLGGRQRAEVCETLLLRARADLDAGRRREAALQLRIGLEALLAELPGAIEDAGHERDLAELVERRAEAEAAAAAALRGELSDEREASVGDLLAIAERVLRRRRVLRD